MNLISTLVGPTVAGLVSVAVAALPTTGAEPAAAAAAERGLAPASGSMSGGDPYFPLDGNGGYQVEHYKIRVTYDPATDRLEGRTVLRAVAEQELSRFHLDLALTPDAVRVDGDRVRSSKPRDHELRVVPSAPIADGATFRVRVDYHGRPGSTRAAGLSPFFHERGEGLALGEPQIGPWWFAANETPEDKATYAISLRVPEGREAVSNGELVSRTTKGRWTTWRWEITDPIVTYLAFFLAGELKVESGTAEGRPYVHAVSKRLGTRARRQSFALMRETPAIVSWLETHFGDYPYVSTGGVVAGIDHLGFALETASRPVYPYVGGPGWDENIALVVHEQAHQWFGDDVSVRRWKDLWLNEGFATYAEWLYAEEHDGSSVAATLQRGYDARPASSSFWDLRVSDPGPDDMWDAPVYQRGGMMLAALRNRIGKADLSELMHEWVADRREGHGTGAEFRALAEAVSGEELDSFFTEWLDDTDKPERTADNGLVVP